MENLHHSKDYKNIFFSSIQSKIAIRDGAHYSRTCYNKCEKYLIIYQLFPENTALHFMINFCGILCACKNKL